LPTGSVVRVVEATPLPFTIPIPSAVAPLKKLTTPPVAGLPPALTETVRVTLLPKPGLVEDAVSTVVVVAGATVTNTGLETAEEKFEVPPKLALTEFNPLGRVDRLIVATPLLTVPDPMGDPLEMKVTTPPGKGLPLPINVAVRATLIPYVGLVEDVISVTLTFAGMTVTVTGDDVEAARFAVPA
jgi:hypothetical protein